MIALSLDDSHDLHLDADGNLAMANDAAAVAQRVKQHLKFWEGEWFLDESIGVPWLRFVFVTPFDRPTAETVIKDAVAAVPGVREITAFDMDFVPNRRQVDVWRLSVLTDFDEVVDIDA